MLVEEMETATDLFLVMELVKVRMGGLTGVQGQSKDGWAHWCQISEHATILRNLARKGSYSLLTFATQTHQFLYLLQTDVTPFLFQRTEL